jgi:DNA-binding transcriptional regulator GbsR (MarR family)
VGGLKDSEHLATLGSSAVHHVTDLELAKRQTTLGGPPQHTHLVIQNYSDWFSPKFHKKWSQHVLPEAREVNTHLDTLDQQDISRKYSLYSNERTLISF